MPEAFEYLVPLPDILKSISEELANRPPESAPFKAKRSAQQKNKTTTPATEEHKPSYPKESEVELTYTTCEAVVEPENLATSHSTGKDLLATACPVEKVPHLGKALPLPTYTDLKRKPKETT